MNKKGSGWKMRGNGGTVCLLTLVLGLGACAARRPILYPNDHVKRVGWDVAERDVDDCVRRAKQFVSSGGRGDETARRVARDTAVGAGTGAAVGAVGGAISGSAGHGAAIGAATGGTAGLLHGLFGGVFERRGPDPAYANFVNRCLRDRGYEPIGWK
ncbi:MAG: glycine zipper family protein [Candidatus Binatia bacterium]